MGIQVVPPPADVLTVKYTTMGAIPPPAPPPPPSCVVDNFNRPDSATTLNPASDGGLWSVDFGGVFGTLGSAAYNVSAVVGAGPVSGPNIAVARRDVRQTAMELVVDIYRSSTAGGSALLICYDPATTYCYELFYDSSSGFATLSRIAADGHPGLGIFLTVTAWTGGTTTLKLRCDVAGVVSAYQLLGTPALGDNFTRADSSSSVGTASDGGVYTVDSAPASTVFGIKSNAFYVVSGGDPNAHVRRNLGSVGADVSVTVKTVGRSRMFLLYAYDPATQNGYYLDYHGQIMKLTAGASSNVGTLPNTAFDSPTTGRVMRVVYNPTTGSHSVYWDGVYKGTVTDPTPWAGPSNTWVGMGAMEAWSFSGETLDDFTASTLDWKVVGSFADVFPLPGTWAGFGTAPTSAGVDRWDSFSACPANSPSPLPIADTFDRADVHDAVNPASDGGVWTQFQYGWQILGNRLGTWSASSHTWNAVTSAVQSNGGPGGYTSAGCISRDLGSAAQELIATLYSNASGNAHAHVHLNLDPFGTGSAYLIDLRSGNVVRCNSGNNPDYTIIGTFPLTAAGGFPSTGTLVRVRHDGAGHISVYLNGVLVGTVTDLTPLQGTWVSLLLDSSVVSTPAVPSWDSFTAVPL